MKAEWHVDSGRREGHCVRSMRPPNASSEETWDRIVTAATEAFLNAGVQNTSMRRVAEEAGVSPGTVSYYFAHKDELIESCLDRYYDRMSRLAKRLVDGAVPEAEPRAFIADALRAFYRFCLEERASIALRARTRHLRGELPELRQRQVLGPYVGLAARALVSITELSEVEARLCVQSITHLFVGYVLQSESELAHVFGGVGSHDDIEDHVVRAGLAMVFPH